MTFARALGLLLLIASGVATPLLARDGATRVGPVGNVPVKFEVGEARLCEAGAAADEGTVVVLADGEAARLVGGIVYSATCCRVCTRGKACGNSCISRRYTCRRPPGCACDG